MDIQTERTLLQSLNTLDLQHEYYANTADIQEQNPTPVQPAIREKHGARAQAALPFPAQLPAIPSATASYIPDLHNVSRDIKETASKCYYAIA